MVRGEGRVIIKKELRKMHELKKGQKTAQFY